LRAFADPWEATRKAAGVEDLHGHGLRGASVTMLVQSRLQPRGNRRRDRAHPAPHAGDLDTHLARTSTMADSAIAKLENVLETELANQTAKREAQSDAK